MTLEAEQSENQLPANGDVVAAVDEIDGNSHLIIADIGRDDAWLSMAEHTVASLESCR